MNRNFNWCSPNDSISSTTNYNVILHQTTFRVMTEWQYTIFEKTYFLAVHQKTIDEMDLLHTKVNLNYSTQQLLYI